MSIKEENSSRLTHNNMMSYLILLLIVVFGFILRLYHLQYFIYLNTDSVWYTYTSMLFSKGKWLLPYTTCKGPFFTFILYLFFRLFKPTFLVGRSVSLFFGSLIPVPIYFLSSKFFSRKAGLLAAFIVSINPTLITYSCTLFREPLFSFIFMSCLFFALGDLRGNVIYSILGGILFSFLSMTIESGIFLGIGILFYYLIQKIKRQEKNGVCKNLDIFFCSSSLTLIPFLLRNYFAYGDLIKQFSRTLGHNLLAHAIMWAYFVLMFLSIPYVIFFRVLYIRVRQLSADFYVKLIRLLLMGFGTLITVMFISTTIAIYILGFKINIDSLRSLTLLPIRWTIGFIMIMESLSLPESMGFLLIILFIVIIYALKSSEYVISGLFSIFLFSSFAFMVALPTHYHHFWNLSFDEIIAHHPMIPFENMVRYCTPFIPLFAIFVSHGILLFTRKLVNGMKGKKRDILETSLVFIIIFVIALQFFYADTNLRLKARNYNRDVLKKQYSSISWLSANASPRVFSFNPLFQEIYGENNVVLLTGISLNEITKIASQNKIEYIVVDMSGIYSDTQLALFFRGYREDESWMPLRSFSLIMNNTWWPYDQLYKISWIDPSKTALVVQNSNFVSEWVSILSDRYLVDIVDEKENLEPHLSGDYKLIVFEDIMRPLEDDEINVLQEKVADGAILIMSGLSPFYLKLEENSQFFGAKVFIEAPKDAKWNITFARDALNIMPNIDLNKSYALYSESPWSSPTGCIVIGHDVVVYSKRATDEAIVIFAKPYFNGTVMFSGVRYRYTSNAGDYDLYTEFIQNMIDKAYNNTLFTSFELETQAWFKAAIFSSSKWVYAPWERILNIMGGSTRNFDETISLLDIDLSEFDIVVFADFLRQLNDTERLYLEESIEKGLTVLVSGISPPYLAGGTSDLTSISTWFGATVFSEVPMEERWKVKFIDDAIEIMELDLEHEYAFYTNSDWSTPTGCVVQPESVVYAYRANDGAGIIFLHEFGEGTSIFIGPRNGFYSPDTSTFEAFLQSLIRFVLVDTE